RFEPLKPVQPPVATVTLAEIYGAQGHFQKATAILDEVLAKEPEHDAARKLRNRLERERGEGSARRTAAAGAVFPEEPEPTAPVQAGQAPQTAAVEEPEPLTPRRLSKQPPPVAVV